MTRERRVASHCLFPGCCVRCGAPAAPLNEARTKCADDAMSLLIA